MPTAFRFLIRCPLNFEYFLALLGYEQVCQELWFPCYLLVTHWANSSSDFPLLTHYPQTLLTLLELKHKFSATHIAWFPVYTKCLSAHNQAKQYKTKLKFYSIFNNEILHEFSIQVFSRISGKGILPHHLPELLGISEIELLT